jgi:TrkA domain protein
VADVVVRSQRLPGVGWRYDLDLIGGSRLVVVVEDGGRRHLMVMRSGDTDPLVSVALTGEQALAVAALVSGARFGVAEEGVGVPAGGGAPGGGAPGGGAPQGAGEEGGGAQGEVVVESLVVQPSSRAVGLPAEDLDRRLGPDATLLAVISDQTPEIVEEERGRPTRPGDRVVVAVRRSRLDEALALLGR